VASEAGGDVTTSLPAAAAVDWRRGGCAPATPARDVISMVVIALAYIVVK